MRFLRETLPPAWLPQKQSSIVIHNHTLKKMNRVWQEIHIIQMQKLSSIHERASLLSTVCDTKGLGLALAGPAAKWLGRFRKIWPLTSNLYIEQGI